MGKDKTQHVRSVMREEMSRGKRPVDEDQRALSKQFKKDFIGLLKEGNARQFKAFLIAHGQLEGSERFVQSMSLWNSYQRDLSKKK